MPKKLKQDDARRVKANLTQCPKAMSGAKPTDWNTIGDLHGNTMKLLYFMILVGAVEFNSSQTKYKKMDAVYKGFQELYDTPAEEWTKKEIDKLDDLLNALKITKKAKIRLIGDVIGDRGNNDYMTLMLLRKFQEGAGCELQVMASNHDMDFIGDVEKEKVDFAVRWFGKDAYQRRSSDALLYLAKKNLIQKKLGDRPVSRNLIPNYVKNISFVEFLYTNEAKGEVTLFAHAPIGPTDIIRAVLCFKGKNVRLDEFGLVNDDIKKIDSLIQKIKNGHTITESDIQEMAKLIEKATRHCAKNKTLHTLAYLRFPEDSTELQGVKFGAGYDKSHTDKDGHLEIHATPFRFMYENRADPAANAKGSALEIQGVYTCVHGHIGEKERLTQKPKKFANCTNIDSDIGRPNDCLIDGDNGEMAVHSNVPPDPTASVMAMNIPWAKEEKKVTECLNVLFGNTNGIEKIKALDDKSVARAKIVTQLLRVAIWKEEIDEGDDSLTLLYEYRGHLREFKARLNAAGINGWDTQLEAMIVAVDNQISPAEATHTKTLVAGAKKLMDSVLDNLGCSTAKQDAYPMLEEKVQEFLNDILVAFQHIAKPGPLGANAKAQLHEHLTNLRDAKVLKQLGIPDDKIAQVQGQIDLKIKEFAPAAAAAGMKFGGKDAADKGQTAVLVEHYKKQGIPEGDAEELVSSTARHVVIQPAPTPSNPPVPDTANVYQSPNNKLFSSYDDLKNKLNAENLQMVLGGKTYTIKGRMDKKLNILVLVKCDSTHNDPETAPVVTKEEVEAYQKQNNKSLACEVVNQLCEKLQAKDENEYFTFTNLDSPKSLHYEPDI